MNAVQIINGDCLAAMRQMRARSVDLVVTSPPYNIGKEYERRVAMARYEEWIWPIIAESARVMKDGAWACWQVGNHVEGRAKSRQVLPLDFVFWPLLSKAGLISRARIVWHFGHGLHNTHSFSGRYETVLVFSKGTVHATEQRALRRLGSIAGVTNVKNNHPEKTAHPCQYPEGLIQPLVEVLTKPGDMLLDPFAGAGTGGAVAVRTGRKATLIELDKGYCRIFGARLAKVEQQVSGDLFSRVAA